jgi:predicted ATPase
LAVNQEEAWRTRRERPAPPPLTRSRTSTITPVAGEEHDHPGHYRTLNLTPQRKKEKILESLASYLAGISRQQPVLMIFEDLQWMDATSREFLNLLVSSG